MGIFQKPNTFLLDIEPKNPITHLPEQEHDWSGTVYGNVVEEIPKDMPKLVGSGVTTTTFLDAN